MPMFDPPIFDHKIFDAEVGGLGSFSAELLRERTEPLPFPLDDETLDLVRQFLQLKVS